MAKKASKPATGSGGHRATYARDKRNGGYLIRVNGPRANMFAGRTIPVLQKSGVTHDEELIGVVWSGTDDGEISGMPGPCALYTFKSKPREELDDEIPF